MLRKHFPRTVKVISRLDSCKLLEQSSRLQLVSEKSKTNKFAFSREFLFRAKRKLEERKKLWWQVEVFRRIQFDEIQTPTRDHLELNSDIKY